jgi:ligand-binding sensor domain-containing protein
MVLKQLTRALVSIIVRRNFLFLIINIIIVDLSLYAQPDYLQFDNLTNELSTNIVNYIYQDKKGWMWFSTSQGLNRYDGVKIKVYKSSPDENGSYVGNLVRFIYEDSKGILWVGTEIGGLNRFNRETETFTCYDEYDIHHKKVYYSANTIAENKQGDLWIGTIIGLKKLDRTTGKFCTYLRKPYNSNSLCDNNVKKICFDRNNRLWIGTSKGIDCFNPETNNFEHIKLFAPQDNDQTICDIFEDHEGKIWVGTYTKGIFIIDPVTKAIQPLHLDKSNEFSLTVRAILQDKAGDYWIGTRGGLYIYSSKTSHSSRFEHDEKNPLSLCHNSILSLCQDNNDNIWLGTRGGISYLIKDKQIFRHYYAYPNDNHYLNNSDIYAFWSDTNKNIWIGTDFGGINIFDPKKQTFRYITTKKQANSLSSSSIKSFLDDKKGNLWIGTYLGGISVYHLKSGRFTNYVNNPNDSGSLIDNRVWSIFLDSRGSIWVGTGKGIDRYDAKSNKFIHYKNTLTSKQVDWIAEDSEYNLWIGTNPVVILYNIKSNSIKRFSLEARSRGFCEDRHNRIWLATQTKGIVLFDKYTGTIKKCYD